MTDVEMVDSAVAASTTKGERLYDSPLIQIPNNGPEKKNLEQPS
jgi:hypothetical protein